MENQIFRYKFSDEFTVSLSQFAKIHQYDHRDDFKEAWAAWTADNEDLVVTETRRLTNNGYEGDIIDKMFKSARYYYRKKSTEKKAPQERRDYTSVSKNFKDAIDAHIEQFIGKPSEGFTDFCKTHKDLLKTEIRSMDNKDPEQIREKIKKTYKNRYFVSNHL
jgi:hypothetical protein